MTAAFQAYADRGVFRGFHATQAGRGRTTYAFRWLFRQPMAATFHRSRARLDFRGLFPDVPAGSAMAADLHGVVAARADRGQPAHKRVDRRRLRLASDLRRGAWSLNVTVRGANHAYAVRTALAVINDLYLTLLERYPEYLIEQFGLSPE